MKEKTTIKQKHMKKILMMFALLLGVSAAYRLPGRSRVAVIIMRG